MSGGIAYVWDKDGTFADRCNKGNVLLQKPGEADRAVIKEMLERHAGHTGSERARLVLEGFEEYAEQFTMLIPRDYQRVLDALGEAKRLKMPEDEGALYAFNSVILGKKAS
jgi:glutamate synthase (ferredoxin)